MKLKILIFEKLLTILEFLGRRFTNDLLEPECLCARKARLDDFLTVNL